MFFITTSQVVTVIPSDKDKSYPGRLGMDFSYKYNSIHLFSNASNVWLLGGSRYYYDEQHETVQYHLGEEIQTKILNLK